MRAVRMILFAALSLFTIGFMAGCGGGGGGGSAPAGSTTSRVTTGQITGFGSVIVNGIEFSRKTGLPDDRVTLSFENNTSASEDNLRVGMIVTITGAVNTSAGTGEYESIEFQPEIRGPLDDAGVDLVNDRLTVLGREVQIEAGTSFDSVRDLAEIAGELQAGRHPELEISGNLGADGIVHATRVARKSDDFIAGTVEIKGAVAASPAPTVNGFSIGTQAIVVNDSTVFANMTRSELAAAAGLLLEVKGSLSGGVITATRVEKEQAVQGAQVEDNISVRGLAASAISNGSFVLNGPNGAITVTTNAATSFMRGGVAATSAIVTAGAALEVQGALQANGSILATKVSIELEKDAKLEGNAASGAFNASANTLTLNGVTVFIASTTRLLDTSGNTLVLGSIAAGDHLQIVGTVDATGKVTASQVQRTSPSSLTFIQGPVTAKTATTLTILGITVDTGSITQASNFVDERSGTKIAGSGTVTDARAAFFALVTLNSSVVKAKGVISGATLIASEVDLEQ